MPSGHTIVLGLSSTPTLLSWVIRWITGQPASHAWIAYWDRALRRWMVVESTYRGLEVRTSTRWQRSNRRARVWAFGVVGEARRAALADGLRWLATLLDTPYDYRGLLWFLVRRWVRRPWQSPRRLKCSEAHVRLLRHIEAPGAFELDPEATTPGDLLAYYRANPGYEELDVAANLPWAAGH